MRRVVLLSVIGCLVLSTLVAAHQSRSKETVFEKMLHSSVFIVAPVDNRRASTGTGSFVGVSPKKNPVVITNYHVISPVVAQDANKEVRVMFPAKNSNGELEQNRSRYTESINDPAYVFRGKVLGYNKKKDLALIEIFIDKARGQQLPRGVYPIPLAADSPKPSTAVHTVGNTGAGGMWSYTPGNVRSVLEKRMRSRGRGGDDELLVEARVIEATNPTNPGDSGGPLVNDEGELVGVTQGGLVDANSIAIFIDIREVKTVLREYKIEVPRRGSAPVARNDGTKTEKTEMTKAEGDLPKAAAKPEAKKTDPRESAAESKLRNARRAIRDKEFGLAEDFLKDILNLYDDTKAAAEAKTLLEELKKRK
jgi:S1-C subfamily serine protease